MTKSPFRKVIDGERLERPIEAGYPNPNSIPRKHWQEFGCACDAIAHVLGIVGVKIDVNVPLAGLIEITAEVANTPILRAENA